AQVTRRGEGRPTGRRLRSGPLSLQRPIIFLRNWIWIHSSIIVFRVWLQTLQSCRKNICLV
uniref:Uncharacterized protein n=1 Tax=Aegilops tauschii subsp. strangulata TaxID=200361 RepID=A0A453IP85_AEGTS